VRISIDIGIFAGARTVRLDPKFQIHVQYGVVRTNHSSCQKTRMNDFSFGIRRLTEVSSVLSQCTRLTDRQTDGRTERRQQ